MTSNRKRDNRDLIGKIESTDRRARRAEKRPLGSDVTGLVSREQQKITPVILGTVNLASYAADTAQQAAEEAQQAVGEVTEVVETLIPRFPNAPATLTGSTTGAWDSRGVSPIAEVLLNWGAVTTNSDGSPSTPNYYEVEAAVTANGAFTTLARVNGTSARVANLPVSVGYSFRVRAFNSPGEAGAYSPVFSITTGMPTAKMAAPTGVGATSQLSVINVTWTGKIGANVDPPLHFRHVYAEIAASPFTTYNRMGAPFLRDTRSITIAGNFTVGADYRVRLVAVDGLGITSDPSGYVTVTVQGVDGAALSASINQTLTEAHDNAQAAVADLATLDDRLSSLDNPGALIDQMRSDIQAAQDTADGLIQRHYSETPPWPNGSAQSPSKVGDLWLKTSTAVAYRWTGTVWDEIPGDDVAVALREAREAQDAAEEAMAAATQAQKEAAGKITTFYTAAQPTATGVGDLWVKTNAVPNTLSRWNGTTWEPVTDSILLNAYIKATDAQATADKKIQTFAQDEAPANTTANDLGVGDIWLDTNDGNKMHRWSGSQWLAIQDQAISSAQISADAAQTRAAQAAMAAYEATSVATVKGQTWTQATPPPAGKTYSFRGTEQYSNSIEKTDGVETRRNLFQNPHFIGTNAAPWSVTAGFNGTNVDGVLDFTLNFTATSNLLTPTMDNTGWVATKPTSASYVVENLSTTNLVLRIAAWNGTVYTYGPDVPVPAGEKRTVAADGLVAPEGSPYMQMRLQAVPGFPVPTGTRLRVSEPIAENTAKVGKFFGGNTPHDRAFDLWIDTASGNAPKSWNGTSWVLARDTTIQAAQNTADLGYWQARAVNAKLLNPDTTFAEGMGGTGSYRAGGGGKTLDRVAAPAGTPTTSGYILRALDSGSATSGTASFTGFYPLPSLTARPGAIFLQRFVARIPVGYEFLPASNAIGLNPGAEGLPFTTGTWLTSNAGTGTWQTYVKLIVCGTTGTFSSTGHVYVRGPGRAVDDPIAMELAQHEVLDLTDTSVKPDIFIQASEPPVAMRKSTTLWIDTTPIGNPAVPGNVPRRWNGTGWEAIQDKVALDAAAAAAKAQQDADKAIGDASTALQSANGRNNVIYSTVNASGTKNPDTDAPNVKGDIWFKFDGGQVKGQWTWSGSAWVPTTVSHEVIASLDAGKITFGEMDGIRIKARTIGTDRLLIGGDSRNLIADLVAETGTVDPHLSGTHGTLGLQGPSADSAGINPGTHYWATRGTEEPEVFRSIVQWVGTNGSISMPVEPSTNYRLGIMTRLGGVYPNGTGSVRWVIRELNAAGTSVSYRAVGSITPDWTWKDQGTTITTGPETVSIRVEIQATSVGAGFRFAHPSLRAQTGAVLIEDGAITTEKIFAGAVTTKALAANAVNAEKMLIGDFTNLIEGADFPGTSTTITADPETGVPGWTPAVGSATVNTTSGLPGRALRFVGPAEAAVWNNRYFEIEPVINNVTGAVEMPSFYLQARYQNQRSVPAILRIQWYSQTKTAIVGGVSDMLLQQTSGSAWATSSDIVGSVSIPGAPTTARYGRLQVLSPTGDATLDASANFYIGQITVRRMNGGELLVDGTIRGRHIETETLETRHFRAESIDGSIISAGTLKVGAVESLFGKDLVLTGNTTILGVYDDMAAMENGIREEIAKTANVYRFDGEAAKITNPASAHQVWIYNDKVEIRVNDTAVSTWTEDKLIVDTFEGTNVTLANHELQTYTGPAGGTIIRALSR